MGYRFESETDSEVLLAAYDCWGEDCVSRFNGMWAFAILDRAKRVVFLSRDRFGIKPLYYVQSPKAFAFGSEIREVLEFVGTPRAHKTNVATFLMMNWCELDESTFFEGVTRLPAGHVATFDLSTHRLVSRRFYDLERRPEIGRLDEREGAERLAWLLEDAVRLRLRSDVKVGTCLSGGLDSSSIAAIAASLYRDASGAGFSAITAVSEEAATNEAHFARLVVDDNGLDWHTVTPTYEDFTESLCDVVSAQEEPYGGASLTMQYFVMKTARANGIKVLLDGQGGDETLLGYDKYYATFLASLVRQEGVGAGIAALRNIGRNNANMRPANMMKYILGGMLASARYARHRKHTAFLRRHPPMPQQLTDFASFRFDTFRLQRLEIQATSLPSLLRFEDKNSMAHGIETRLPFLDYRLVEFNLSLRNSLKIHDGWMKWILRKAMQERLPNAIAWRKDKFGFEAPSNVWYRRHRSEMERAITASPLLNNLANMDKLRAEMGGLRGDYFWRLFSVAAWESAFGVVA
jgi:asparagine synthase (glutamine-hydrolysing)